MTTKLFEVTRASIVRFGSVKPVIQPFFSWSISAEERWAIVGRVGSGKSSLGSALAGGLRWVAEDGRVSEELANPWIYRGAGSTERAVRLLAFTDNLKSYSSHSIQDRYHSRVDEDELTAAEFLLDLPKARKVYALVKDGEENPVNNATNKVIDPFAKLDDHKRQIAKKFNLEALFPLPTIRLSNGQLMRLRLAKNLLFSDAVDAKVVVLDEPFS
ncbi:hypothetical protein HK100_003564 [Physocladia obscura]|uniref:ABC transporter domain-containing protein n=1 Tax=Physocladia obscura TaxID=109957 RepID=A0AAD5XEI4_9FUNG|nr:hypothetical protein HK100_003564 [Physocladia obscura]